MTLSDSLPRHVAGRIKDARGRKVTQLDPVAMNVLHRNDEGIPPGVLRELTQQIGFGKLAASPLGLWGGVVAFVCVLLLLGDGITQLIKGNIPFSAFVLRAILYQGIWVVPLTFWVAARHSRFHLIRKIMLDHCRCPHCGYDIRGLPVDPTDGATICPECACAWQLRGGRK